MLLEQYDVYKHAWRSGVKHEKFLLDEMLRSGDVTAEEYTEEDERIDSLECADERVYCMAVVVGLVAYCHPVLWRCKEIVGFRKSSAPLSKKGLGPKDGAIYVMAMQNIEKCKRNVSVIFKVMMPFVVMLRKKRAAAGCVAALLRAHAKATLFPRCFRSFHSRLSFLQRTWRKNYATRKNSLLMCVKQLNKLESPPPTQPPPSAVFSSTTMFTLKNRGVVEMCRQLTDCGEVMYRTTSSSKKSSKKCCFQFKIAALRTFKEASRDVQTSEFFSFWEASRGRRDVPPPRTRICLLPTEAHHVFTTALSLQATFLAALSTSLQHKYASILRVSPWYLHSLLHIEWGKVDAEGKAMEQAFFNTTPGLFTVEEWGLEKFPAPKSYLVKLDPVRNLYHEGLEVMRKKSLHHHAVVKRRNKTLKS